MSARSAIGSCETRDEAQLRFPSHTHPLGLVNLVHIRGKSGGARAQSNAHAVVVEVRLAAAWLVVAAKIAGGKAGEIHLNRE